MAQGVYDPYTREPLPDKAPRWMRAIAQDPNGVSYKAMQDSFKMWLATDVDARVKTIERKPAVNFFRRWARAYQPFVNSAGRISLPSIETYWAKLDKRNAQASYADLRATNAQNIAPWRSIGPMTTYKRDAGTRQTQIKDSQACVFRITVAKSNTNILYSGTETGVVFRTDNKGEQWRAVAPQHDFGGSIYAIAIHPTNPDIVLVGGGLGLWRTTNGGNSWSRIEGINARVNSIRFNPTHPDRVTIAAADGAQTPGGFYTSNDGGQTVTRRLKVMCYDHELKPNDPNHVYLLARENEAKGFEMYISHNGGETFASPIKMRDHVRAGRLAVTNAPGGENYVYALVTTNPNTYPNGPLGDVTGPPYILRSVDAGRTWEDKTVRGGRSNTFSPFVDDERGGQGYFDMMIGVSDKNPDHVIFGLTSAYRSLRGGAGGYRETAIGGYQRLDWMHPDMQDIAIAGDEVWISTDGGVKYSNDFFATAGEYRHKGIYASDYHGFDQAWNEDVMAGGRWHNGDAVHSASYGDGNTLHVGGVEWATGHIMMSNPRKVYFSDAGTSIVPERLDGEVITTHGEYFSSKRPYEVLALNGRIAYDPRYAHRLVINSQEEPYELYESTDEGRSFRRIWDSDGESISNFEFARSNPDYMYVCGDFDIYRSTDGGKTFVATASRPFKQEDNNHFSLLTVHPRNHLEVWVANANFDEGGVSVSRDGGDTWELVRSERLKGHRILWVILTGDQHNGVYLGTHHGAKVFYKDDTMTDWIDYSEGLNPGARVTRLVPFYAQGKLRMATNQGVWERPLYRPVPRPTAQPMATNLGSAVLSSAQQEVQLDSYSIVNHEGAQWHWSITPQPQRISDAHARNPKVVFGRAAHYDITLTVSTPNGSDSRTVRDMVKIGNQPNKNLPDITALAQVEAETATERLRPTVQQLGQPLMLDLGGLAGEARLTLHTTRGALVARHDMMADGAVHSIPTDGLTAGVYIYELRLDGRKFFGKFILHP